MTTAALGLILLSAFLHAYWNLLAKKSADQVSFMFLIMLASPLIWLVPLLWMVWHGVNFGPWYLPVLGGICQALYLFLLGRCYECGDFSRMYPVARGLAPALIALLAWPILGESLSLVGVMGILLVGVGVAVVSNGGIGRPAGENFRTMVCQPCFFLPILCAVTIAAYHLTDKAGAMAADSPMAYLSMMYLYLIVFLGVLTFLVRRPADIGREWRTNWRSVLIVTVFCFAAYFLVVTAMKLAPVAYIASGRNLSILLSVVMGSRLLGEKGLRWRLAGSLLILAGIATMTFIHP